MDQVDWLRLEREAQRWETGRASLIPEAIPMHIEDHRTIAPPEPMQGMFSQAFLHEDSEALQPQWLCAQGLAHGGFANAHTLMAQLIADLASEWCG